LEYIVAAPWASIIAVAGFAWLCFLLVDDDVEARPLLEHILLDNGYQVVTAESIATATELLSSQPSISPSAMSTLADGAGSPSPIGRLPRASKRLLVTGYDMSLEPGSLAPCVYLPKPLRVIELLDGIERCLAAAVEAHRKSSERRN